MPAYQFYRDDLPDGLALGDCLAIDSEFMGLNVYRDRLCLVQICDGDGITHIVQLRRGFYDAPNLKKILADASRKKLFFYARADMRWFGRWLGVVPENVYCLKIAARLIRTNGAAHNLEDVIRDYLGIRISKEQQRTDWGSADLTPAQLEYACNDVIYLHALHEVIGKKLADAGRRELAQGLFSCLPPLVRADLAGWGGEDLFAHD